MVRSGQTVDGVTGPFGEAMGVSSIFGLAQSVSDQAAGSPLFPGGPEVLVIKKALGGQPKSGFVLGGTH